MKRLMMSSGATKLQFNLKYFATEKRKSHVQSHVQSTPPKSTSGLESVRKDPPQWRDHGCTALHWLSQENSNSVYSVQILRDQPPIHARQRSQAHVTCSSAILPGINWWKTPPCRVTRHEPHRKLVAWAQRVYKAISETNYQRWTCEWYSSILGAN